MNKWIGVGRLTKDPELKFTNGAGTAVATFSLAVDRRFVNQATGQREADFINIVCWRKNAEFVANYFKKGQQCAIVGTLQTRTYQAQDGTNRHVTEVVADEIEFVGSKKQEQGTKTDTELPDGYVSIDDDCSDIPF